MAEEEKKEKKIIVDEDWKNQARKERQQAAEKEKAEEKIEEKGGEQEKASAEKQGRGPLPEGNFAALVSMLVTQAFFAMGLIKPEGQEKKEPDLELARYNIDMLRTIQEKTRGNLAEEEEKVLENTLNQVQMAYVQISG